MESDHNMSRCHLPDILQDHYDSQDIFCERKRGQNPFENDFEFFFYKNRHGCLEIKFGLHIDSSFGTQFSRRYPPKCANHVNPH